MMFSRKRILLTVVLTVFGVYCYHLWMVNVTTETSRDIQSVVMETAKRQVSDNAKSPSRNVGMATEELYLNNVAMESANQKPKIFTYFDPKLDKPSVCDKAKEIVPNIVHWTWFFGVPRQLLFHQYVCALSAIWIQKPSAIYLWYDALPKGDYWDNITQEAAKNHIEMVYKQVKPPEKIFGIHIMYVHHKSDIQRYRAIMEYGGIYMDLDVVILKSFQPLLCYETTMGQETPHALNIGIIIGAKNSTFMNLLYESYREYNPKSWDYNSIIVPQKIANEHPELIHIEHTTMNKPNWGEKPVLYNGTKYDWSHNYCVHTWYRVHAIEYNMESIKYVDMAVAEMFRFVLFGDPRVQSKTKQ